MIEDVPDLVLSYFKTKTQFKVVEDAGNFSLVPRKATAQKSAKTKSPR